jgi:molecular chaperone Hsp33
LSATIKFAGRLSLQFQGTGKLRLLLVQSNQGFHVRGLIQTSADDWADEKELLSELKKGVLVITMDPDDTAQRYQGIVAWQGDSLSASVEGYFRNSEQLMTRIWIAVDEHTASGMLLQVMPDSKNPHARPMTDTNPDWEHIIHLTNTIKPNELLTLDNQVILHRLYVQEDVRLFEPETIIFRCTCSRKRGENAILMLGRTEADEELQSKQQIVVTCEFCNSEFAFDRVDVENIFRKGQAPPPSSQVH